VDRYLTEARAAWPNGLYAFIEEVALCYLAMKGYDVTVTLDAIRNNIDEVIRLTRTFYDRFHVSIGLIDMIRNYAQSEASSSRASASSKEPKTDHESRRLTVQVSERMLNRDITCPTCPR
jgi:hypothetical protein